METLKREVVKIGGNRVEVLKEEVDLDKLLQDCIEYFMFKQPRVINSIQRGQEKKEIIYEEIYNFLKIQNIEKKNIEKVISNFEKYVWGYGKLQKLIEDSDISDIKIISKDNVRIKKNGKRMSTDVKFKSDEELENFVNFIAIKNKSSISEIKAIQTITDKSNKKCILRINISSQYVNSVSNPYMHIRKIPKEKKDLDKLEELNMLTKEEKNFLMNAVRNGDSIIITGKGGSGKTTLINALLDVIPQDKSALVIQESEELFSQKHPEMMFQRVRYNKGEGRIQYELKDLGINGLLLDLDYFIIGEVKGAEALYLLNACYTGHCCIASVHGNSPEGAINKLVDYMKYESNYNREELLSMLKDIALVVYLDDFKIKEIAALSGFDYESKKITYKSKFKNSKKVGE